ncbi:SDR family oxidoreductase [Cellulomonas sp. PhB143]|uniref:SDR family oxidoreductase n=1 Tax=Cellulomonas sp. PhB143 TaxID=2485186 RepID=UPI000F4750EA|nr:SDR family oxidoreductase [Cellulomonas sp. PhB143]ROS79135.1 NAD(P)-dependent dehydrogenase (short-subunit alcohol dehydrogenase family) [Cellulomonas sp. PhB143]
MDLGLEGTTAVVTGASKGIGLAVTRALAAEGVHVFAGARGSSPELDELAAAGSVRLVAVDLSTAAGSNELVAAALDRGGLDILVNNVGQVSPRLNGFLMVSDDEWLRSLNLNLMAAVRTTRAALPAMLAEGHGSIVTISSVNAFLPDPPVLDYGAAKAALTNFSKGLSKEVGAHGVRLNTISPGPVATDLWLGDVGVAAAVGQATGRDPGSVAQDAAAQSVTGRFTRPDEIATLAVLLASDRASGNVTGSDFVIDGGLTTQT